MKGVILAGGLGTRMAPLTHITNKHLLPVYDMPMVHYPLMNLVKSGIKEVMLVTGGAHAGHFIRVLKNGKDYGLKKLEYAYQEGEGGIAEALKLARDFVGDEAFVVMLGDNIYQFNARKWVEWFQIQQFKSDRLVEAMVLSKQPFALDPARFGVAVVPESQMFMQNTIEPLDIVEKPVKKQLEKWADEDKSVDILTGTYFYTPDVFDICDRLKPSQRGELEISDVNRHYLQKKTLVVSRIPGWWTDAGTFPSLLKASNWVEQDGANNDFDEGVQ